MAIPRRSSRLIARVAAVTGIERAPSLRLTTDAIARARLGAGADGHYGPILDRLWDDGWWWGEVLGWNRFYLHPIAAVVRAWMESPTHREVLMDPRRDRIGGGVWVQWSTGRWYFCVLVGQRNQH